MGSGKCLGKKVMIENKKNEKIAKELVEKLFPREKWERYAVGLYVAKRRIPKNKKQQEIFEKEIHIAKILSKKWSYCLYVA